MIKVSNENLAKALDLRSKDQYKEGLVYLRLACEEGDGVALALLGAALLLGGWGVEVDDKLGITCLDKSIEAGYHAATILHPYRKWSDDPIQRAVTARNVNVLYELSKKDVCCASYGFVSWVWRSEERFDVTHLIALNDAHINCYLAQYCTQVEDVKFNLLIKSAKQGFNEASLNLIHAYNVKKEYDLAAPYAIQQGLFYIEGRITFSVDLTPARLRELCLYGEHFVKTNSQMTPTRATCIHYYEFTKTRVKDALIAWWIVAKRMRLYSDLRRLISEHVLKSARDPSVWLAVGVKKKKIKVQ
jgi:hypothetical protein